VLYRDIIKKAFILTWKNRFLWIFGFFASFLSLGGANEAIMRSGLRQSMILDRLSSWSFLGINMTEAGFFTAKSIVIIAAAVALITVMILAFFYLAIISVAAIIRAANLLDKGKKTDFTSNFEESKKQFWPVAGINIAGKALIVLFLLLIGTFLSLTAMNGTPAYALLYLFTFLIFAAASLVISFLAIYASAYHVLKTDGIRAAVHDAWILFRSNWVVSVESAAILFFINLAAKATIMVFMFISALPFLMLLMMGYFLAANFLPVAIVSLWMILGIILMILAGSFFSAFQLVAWTLLFDKIAKGRIISKLHRIFGKN
jgi:hypothetical protein